MRVGELSRYDRRWRRTQRIELIEATRHEIHEGLGGRFLVAAYGEDSVCASVRDVRAPEFALASGTYQGGLWSFDGDSQAWATVPEYLLLDRPDGRSHMIRIADGAQADPLEGLAKVCCITAVPDSRLVALAGDGHLTIWDPVARRAGAHFRLAQGTDQPTMRFVDGGEHLWVNDGSTMLQLETRHWDPVDAAGSEQDTEVITFWSLSAGGSYALVGRRDRTDVICLDTSTMLPTGQASFDRPLLDAEALGRHVVGIDRNAQFVRSSIRTFSATST